MTILDVGSVVIINDSGEPHILVELHVEKSDTERAIFTGSYVFVSLVSGKRWTSFVLVSNHCPSPIQAISDKQLKVELLRGSQIQFISLDQAVEMMKYPFGSIWIEETTGNKCMLSLTGWEPGYGAIVDMVRLATGQSVTGHKIFERDGNTVGITRKEWNMLCGEKYFVRSAL